jgi:tripartite-type tricarboxylate transporter receptor subunit TctC
VRRTPLRRVAKFWWLGLAAAFVAAVQAFSIPSVAQDAGFPRKPVHVVIPYSPGSPTDINTRKVIDVAQRKLGATIVPDNKPGVSGTLGATYVAKAAADGYTLLAAPGEVLIAGAVLNQPAPFDSIQDFSFIAQLYAGTPFLIANSARKIGTLQQLIDKAKTEEITFGSFGPGSFHQVTIAEFMKRAGISLKEVAYRSPIQAMQALLSNEVALGYTSGIQATELVKQGKVGVLAVIGMERRPVFPNIPTFVEAGFDAPILRTPLWVGVMGQRALPSSIVAKLNEAFVQALRDPEITEFMSRVDNVPLGNTPEDFESKFRAEYENMVPILKALGIRAQ